MKHILTGYRLLFLAAILGLACAACQGNSQDATLERPSLQQDDESSLEPPQTGMSDVFAPPSELIKRLNQQRAVSYVEANLVKAGEDFELLLPNNLATPGTGVVFNPTWSGASADAKGLAYCMYEYSIDGYDRNAQVRYAWSTPPSVIGEAWIGLGNWDTDRWDWYQCNAAGKNNFPSMDPYIAFGGGLLLAVVVHGSDTSTLTSVRIGTELAQPAFSASPRRGFAPLSVNFDASASVDPDGTITRYSWDLDGNGSFETDTGTSPETSYEYTIPDTYNVALRVTDNDAVTAVVEGDVGVTTEFAHTWGTNANEAVGCIKADSAGNLYQAGQTGGVGDGASALIVKYNAVGQPVWAKAFDGSTGEAYNGIVISVAGLIYVCGLTDSFGSGDMDDLLQCWNTDGELIWSKVWGGAARDVFNDIIISGTSIYVAGETSSFGSDIQAVVVRYNLDGNVIWNKVFGGPGIDRANALAMRHYMTDDPKLHVVGMTKTDEDQWDLDILYYTFREDGTYIHRKSFGDDWVQVATDIVVPGIFGGKTIIAAETSSDIFSYDWMFVSISDSWAKTWEFTGDNDCNQIIKLPDGNFTIAGTAWQNAFTSYDAVLATITSTGAPVSLEIRDHKGQLDNGISIAIFGDAMVVGGRAHDNTSDWAQHNFELSDHQGVWKNILWQLNSAGATVMDANGDVLPVTDGVLDTGGGGYDFLYELRKLE